MKTKFRITFISLAVVFLFSSSAFALDFPKGVMPPTEHNIELYAKYMSQAQKNTVSASEQSSDKERAQVFRKIFVEPMKKLGYNYDLTIRDYAKKIYSGWVPNVTTNLIVQTMLLQPRQLKDFLFKSGIISAETFKLFDDEDKKNEKIEAEEREKARQAEIARQQKMEDDKREEERIAAEAKRIEEEKALKLKKEALGKISGHYENRNKNNRGKSIGELNIQVVSEDKIGFSLYNHPDVSDFCKVENKTATLEYENGVFTAIFEELKDASSRYSPKNCILTMITGGAQVDVETSGCNSYCRRGGYMMGAYVKTDKQPFNSQQTTNTTSSELQDSDVQKNDTKKYDPLKGFKKLFGR